MTMPDVLLYSAIGGIAANVAAALIRLFRDWLNARRKLEEAEENGFQVALSSDSLTELGSYLDGPIGSFLIKEYSDNAKVKDRVNTFLARLEEFVGKTGEVPLEAKAPDMIERGPEPIGRELYDVEVRLQEGRSWDALALLRRDIERRLMSIAAEHEIKVPAKFGAGRILQLLIQRNLLPKDVGVSLRYAIDVANRGIHGLNVSTDEVFEALQHARQALGAIEWGRNRIRID